MKKIILFLLLTTIVTVAFSQLSPRRITLLTNYSLASGDTTAGIPTSDDYVWSMSVRTAHLDTNNAVVTVQCSYDNSNWFDYAGSLTQTLTDTAGTTFGFEDIQTAFNYLRLKVTVNDVTSGNIWANLTLHPK